jgi:hypothetical protein
LSGAGLVAELRAGGHTLAEIGKVTGVTRQAVSVMLWRIAEANSAVRQE